MGNFDNTLARMKALYTYGKGLDEGKKIDAHTLEHKATAADGRTYGIIKECNKYYIKVAPTGRETIAESYEYLGGFCNKKNYEYTSYNNALKNFEMKMASINEAHEGNVNISTLDPFKKGDFIVEGTDKMKNEIARQRQIMHNVSMLMNESSTIGASRKDDVVMYDGKNPEAETGKKGDEGMTSATAKPEYAGSKTNGVDKKVGPFDNDPSKCEDQLKESCDCGDSNCTCDWGSEGIGKGEDPKRVGWEMEGQQVVNEEEEDWASKGLPSTPGVGEADTDHNNDPFNKTVNESEEDAEMDVETDDVDVMDDDFSEDDFGTEEDMDFEDDVDFGTDDMDLGDEEESFDDIEGDSEMDSDDDILAKIEELQAQIDMLKSQISADGEPVDGDEEVLVDGGDETDFESDFNSVDDSEFGDEPMEEPVGDEMEEPVEDEGESFDEMDECGNSGLDALMESIVNKVVAEIMNEDVLHDFGKHPGYRKKPMELPTTGEDKNQWGEDWNDESVYSEEPFGSKIGSSAPFEMLVDTVTKDVMSQLSGEAFKKKVN